MAEARRNGVMVYLDTETFDRLNKEVDRRRKELQDMVPGARISRHSVVATMIREALDRAGAKK